MSGNSVLSAPVAALLEQAGVTPSRTVLIAGGHAWTAAGLVERSARIASGLRERGVASGDRVALHMYNTAEAVLAYLACLWIGAIATPLNPRLTAPELADLVDRTRPVLYLGQQPLAETFGLVPEALLSSSARFVDPAPADSLADRTFPTEAASSDTVAGPDSLDPDAPAILLPTSGTTGLSKIVIWSHRTLAGLHLSADGRAMRSGETFPLLTPLMHGAAVYGLLNAITQRATAVLSGPSFDADEVLDAIATHRITSLWGLPFMCAELVRCQRSRPRDVSSLVSAAVAGDVCPPRVETDFAELFGVPLRSYWAAAEDVGATITSTRVGPFMQLVPEAAARIVGPDGQTTAPGETGELLISSPTTSPGYWDSPPGRSPIHENTFHSGDLVREIEPGLLEYMGRHKDLIIRGGSNISPREVEDVLRRHPAVADVAVAAVPDELLGQRVGALLVLVGDVTTTDVLEWAVERLAGYKIPERVQVADVIPRNDLTKVDRMAVTHVLTQDLAQELGLDRASEDQ